MPIPLVPVLLGLVAAGTGGYGIKKGVEACSDYNKASSIDADAREIYDKSKNEMSEAREASKTSLEKLGNLKIDTCNKQLAKFIYLFDQIHNIETNNSTGLDELKKFKIDNQSMSELKEVTMNALSFVKGTLGGTVAGGAVAFGAYGLAGTLATASTGTAISTLGGAAATNATLAFFGGGALTVGGLGVAGGTMILGAIVAGPAIAVLGSIMGSKAYESLENAKSNLAKAKEVQEELKLLITTCKGIKSMADLFSDTLSKLNNLIDPALTELIYTISVQGKDYKKYNSKAKQSLSRLLALIQAVKALIDTPILDKDGSVTQNSKQVVCAVQRQIEAI